MTSKQRQGRQRRRRGEKREPARFVIVKVGRAARHKCHHRKTDGAAQTDVGAAAIVVDADDDDDDAGDNDNAVVVNSRYTSMTNAVS